MSGEYFFRPAMFSHDVSCVIIPGLLGGGFTILGLMSAIRIPLKEFTPEKERCFGLFYALSTKECRIRFIRLFRTSLFKASVSSLLGECPRISKKVSILFE